MCSSSVTASRRIAATAADNTMEAGGIGLGNVLHDVAQFRAPHVIIQSQILLVHERQYLQKAGVVRFRQYNLDIGILIHGGVYWYVHRCYSIVMRARRRPKQ
jgi:hypothetical protein